jgi:hypothetical protein
MELDLSASRSHRSVEGDEIMQGRDTAGDSRFHCDLNHASVLPASGIAQMWIPLITAHLQVDQPLSAISRLNPELQFNRSRNQYRRHFKVACITTYAFPLFLARCALTTSS